MLGADLTEHNFQWNSNNTGPTQSSFPCNSTYSQAIESTIKVATVITANETSPSPNKEDRKPIKTIADAVESQTMIYPKQAWYYDA